MWGKVKQYAHIQHGQPLYVPPHQRGGKGAAGGRGSWGDEDDDSWEVAGKKGKNKRAQPQQHGNATAASTSPELHASEALGPLPPLARRSSSNMQAGLKRLRRVVTTPHIFYSLAQDFSSSSVAPVDASDAMEEEEDLQTWRSLVHIWEMLVESSPQDPPEVCYAFMLQRLEEDLNSNLSQLGSWAQDMVRERWAGSHKDLQDVEGRMLLREVCVVEMRCLVGHFLLQQSSFGEARQQLDHALTAAETLQVASVLCNTHEALARLHHFQFNTQEAMHHLVTIGRR